MKSVTGYLQTRTGCHLHKGPSFQSGIWVVRQIISRNLWSASMSKIRLRLGVGIHPSIRGRPKMA